MEGAKIAPTPIMKPFFFFWTGIRVPIACSLLGVGSPAQNNVYRGTRLCPYIVLSSQFSTPHPYSWRGISSCAVPSSHCASSLSHSAAALYFDPSRYKSSCSHHHWDTHAPGLQIHSSKRSIFGRVAIYCATVFCLLVIYTPISSNPDSYIAAAIGGYS